MDDTADILVVEDSRIDAIMIQRILESSKVHIHIAHNCHDGLKCFHNVSPDLVLLDVMLPDGNGYDLCKAMKADSAQNGMYVPIILLTVMDQIKDKVRGFESGADDYVVKPPVRDELKARVKSLLRIKNLQQELRNAHNQLAETHSKLQKELDTVETIQLSFLPHQFPDHDELSIASRYVPSMKAGGDYHDVIPIDGGHWGIVMADISGHGASAAVIMALTQMTVKECAAGILNPIDALHKFNTMLSRHVHTGHFVTMGYGVLNHRTMRMRYASAGHTPLLHYCAREQCVRQCNTQKGFPLISFEGNEFDELELAIESGDRLLFLTDGMYEMVDHNYEFFGLERLQQSFADHIEDDVTNLVDGVLNEARKHHQANTFHDDLSVMVLARKARTNGSMSA